MAEVKVKNLTKKFGDSIAVDNITLDFPEGKLTVLVGPSGCGKTTLLRMLAGLEETTAGELIIGGKNVAHVPAWDRNVAMVFQSYALYPNMTVFRNMAFPLEARKMSKVEIKKQVEKSAEILGLTELLNRYPRQLSGGQMQRVAIGRAIVRNPDVFLMDEPLSNLDAKLRVSTRAELKHLQRELGVTTVYVTHDQAEAMTLADQLVVMNAGRILQVDYPEFIYYHPQQIFVGGFIGNPGMNFIPCQLNAERSKLVNPHLTYELPLQIIEKFKDFPGDKKLILGIRPEDITLYPQERPGAMKVSVYVTEELGKETLVTVKYGESFLKLFVPPIVAIYQKIGLDVWLHFKPEGLRIFDAASQELLLDCTPEKLEIEYGGVIYG
ncbi:MAG: ABC transporter ATP-binding protein [Anaerolineales bacterium]|nr:ABC transporter ATP-binding protein [Anaerolineales bacterium]